MQEKSTRKEVHVLACLSIHCSFIISYGKKHLFPSKVNIKQTLLKNMENLTLPSEAQASHGEVMRGQIPRKETKKSAMKEKNILCVLYHKPDDKWKLMNLPA